MATVCSRRKQVIIAVSIFIVGALIITTWLLVKFLKGHSSTNPCGDGNLLDDKTQECFRRGSKANCPGNLVFLEISVEKTHKGGCACPFPFFNRTLLYDEKEEACFFVFTQGPCEDNEWLNVTRQGKPICETNLCLDSSNDTIENSIPFWTGTEYMCVTEGENLRPDCTVGFQKNRISATCLENEAPNKETVFQTGSIGVGATPCPIGSFPSIMGKCQPKFDFDFN